jgi:glucose-6-phosphate 1-dehydrogenase
VLQAWETPPPDKQATPLHCYDPGSWGPDAADEIIERDGRRWRHAEAGG